MFEALGLDMTPRAASVWLGLGLGVLFGGLAAATGFCFRRAVAGAPGERLPAAALWAVALASAVAGTQAAVWAGWIGFDGHRFTAASLPWLAIAGGGFLFGIGMALTRGCPARLTVLAAAGNLRAAIVLVVFAVVALATMRGLLAPPRLALAGVTVPTPGSLPGPAALWVAGLAAVAAALAWRARLSPREIAAGIAIGLLVPAGWVGTGFLLADDFDPIPFESLSYTGPWGEALFWGVAATAVAPAFGAGLVGGTIAGAAGFALVTRGGRWEGFSGPGQMARYLAGAALMGFGGVAAGGCTIGAGLAGAPALGLAGVLALAAIGLGGALTGAVLSRARGSGGP